MTEEQELTTWRKSNADRDKQFGVLLYPRVAYETNPDFTVSEVTITSFGINPGCSSPVCHCISPTESKFQCSSEMLYITIDEAKQQMVDDLRDGIAQTQKQMLEITQNLVNHTTQLRALEQDLKL
jgi:hypothetical protein